MVRSEQTMTEERNDPSNSADDSPELDARLNQIETATEEDSNVNEDFVHWLKTSFPIYVLAFTVAAGGYIWYFQDQATQQANTIDAWREFRAASNPNSLLELADEQEVNLPHLSVQARLQAGTLQLQAVRRNRPVNAEADSTETLSDEAREATLLGAEAAFRAAVAECRGDLDAATSYYEQAESAAQSIAPFAARFRTARETMAGLDAPRTLPTAAEVSDLRSRATSQSTPTELDPVLTEILGDE
jgi:hypothetical protein